MATMYQLLIIDSTYLNQCDLQKQRQKEMFYPGLKGTWHDVKKLLALRMCTLFRDLNVKVRREITAAMD